LVTVLSDCKEIEGTGKLTWKKEEHFEDLGIPWNDIIKVDLTLIVIRMWPQLSVPRQ
jgi:sporulation protein YlmC with PRC-barrel domain